MRSKRNKSHHGAVARFERLTAQLVGETGVRLTNGRLLCELSVLAEDLFRVRVTPGAEFSAAPSWAVSKPAWPCSPAQISRSGRKVRLRTSQGVFSVDLVTGRWQLEDRFGLEVFACRAGGMFVDDGPFVRLSLTEGESIFGLGESSGTFNKRGLIREFWNIDLGGHASAVYPGLRNIYVSIPFGISVREGRASGVFWDNPSRQTWDLGQTQVDQWQMRAASGEIDLYLFLGPTCEGVVQRYTELTGRMPLPPLWGLGYQQCRYSYETRARVEKVARTFRRRQIPCDVIYLDIHHMDGYRVFTFGKRFPNPREMIARLARQGFKTVTIIDPGVKDDPQFPVLRRGVAKSAFVKAAEGNRDYFGDVWPGRVRFPDFLNPACRAWWGEEQRAFQRLGIAGFWNDMNEPAVFSTPDKHFPGDCIHQTPSGPRLHAAVHNVYGSEMARASYEGAVAAAPNRRPFTITRAGYAGLQRHALVWTGDNDSCWEHLADSVQMLLNLSLSGVPFCGADVGGFRDNTTGELLARWMQLAALTPFFRNHSDLGSVDQEPWAFGPRIEAICRRYIELRYQLLPYLYGLFVQAHRHGAPIMRPLLWHYQNDPRAVAAGDQFMLGADLLVAPILRQGATARSVYLPTDTWIDFWTGETFRGGRHILAEAELNTLPLFVRSGAVLPLIPVQQYVGERKADTVNLHIWPGPGGRLDWYEDDGHSFDYSRGGFHERVIGLSRRKNASELTFSAVAGDFHSRVKRWRLILRNMARPVRARLGRRSIPAAYDEGFGVCILEVRNSAEAFAVEWR